MSKINRIVTLQLSYFYEYLISIGCLSDEITFDQWCNDYSLWLKSFTKNKKESI